jgi:DNA (cytosine-5)-methyltransferase 1
VTNLQHLPRPAALTDTIAAVALTSIEICAGGGGQALGLERAGFKHLAVVELDPHACATLRWNRPYWNTLEDDVTQWRATRWRGKVDLVAGGVPCPPFSQAGKQLGSADERDLFPAALRIVRECQPDAVVLENVRGLMGERFDDYRANIDAELNAEGFATRWKILNACDFGVPQLRPRTVLVALRDDIASHFKWPTGRRGAPTVGEVLAPAMAAAGWESAGAWAAGANRIAPTLVGGSTRHGGPDLGPTRARQAWAVLGVDGRRIADAAPQPGFTGLPGLTLEMAALIQGFPPEWQFFGRKTHAYRQVGNAFPPAVARAVGLRVASALRRARREPEPVSRQAAA